MLVSMTGYCSTTERIEFSDNRTVTLTIELKALNGRFFEVIAKLPGSLSHLELLVTNMLQGKLSRGKVYLNVNFDKRDAGLETIAPSMFIVEQYLEAAQALKTKFNLEGSVSIADVMNFPSALVAHDFPFTAGDEEKILALLGRVAERLMEVRAQEGKRLERDFKTMFAVCAQKVDAVSATFNAELDRQKASLNGLLATQVEGQSTQPIEELQLAIKKMDIHEEITRFKSHLEGVVSFLSASGLEKGKRLDFILQELLRETNTMMAKSSAFAISTACIDIKVELEKAREQVQNIV